MGAGRKTSWLNRLRSELQRLRDDPNGFSSLGGDVLDACVREALRMTAHTIGAIRKVTAPDGYRISKGSGGDSGGESSSGSSSSNGGGDDEDDGAADCVAPHGSYVAISHVLPHLKLGSFPSAGAFRPERFLEERDAPSPSPIPIGTTVELRGLKAKPELNGQPGIVVDFDTSFGRCRVKLEDGRGPFNIKPENLRADVADDYDDDDDDDVDGKVLGSARSLSAYELTSFSHGIHICPGQRYALVLVKQMVAFCLDGPLSHSPRPSNSSLDFTRATLAQRSAKVRVGYKWREHVVL